MKQDEYQQYMFDLVRLIEVKGFLYTPKSVDQSRQSWKAIEPVFLGDSDSWNSALLKEEGRDALSWNVPVVLNRTTQRRGYACVLVMNLGKRTLESLAAQLIISQIMNHEFFEELRTKQKTAYYVDSFLSNFEDELLQYLVIRSTTHMPEDLSQRIELFMDFFGKSFSHRVSPDRIELVRNALIAQVQNGLIEVSDDQVETFIDALKTVSNQAIYNMAEQMFSLSNAKRLSVLVKGQASD